MMKTKILLILILFSLSAEIIPNDSLIFTQLNERKSDKERIDSLEKELLFYKVKEDYFVQIPTIEAGRYGVMLLGFVVILTFFASFVFYLKFNNFKKENKELKKRFEELEDYVKKQTGNQMTTLGVIWEVASLASYKDDPLHSFYLNLLTARTFIESNAFFDKVERVEKFTKKSIEIMEDANKKFLNMTFTDKDIEYLVKKENEILEVLGIINLSSNPQLLKLSSSIITKLSEVLKEK